MWLIVLLSGALYWVLALWFPLGIHVDRWPPADVRSLAPTLASGLAYALILVILFFLQVLAFRKVWGGSLTRIRLPGNDSRRALLGPLALIALVAVLIALPLLLTYPVNANDIFRYAMRGRITSIHGGNPFTQPPEAFPADPFLPFVGEWAEHTSPYGPLWESVAAMISAVSGETIFAAVLAFKLLGLLMILVAAILLWFQMGHLSMRHRSAYTLLWAWNPAVLLTFVVDGHNDGLMLVWLLLGWLLAQRSRPLVGLLAVFLAVLTKPIAILVVPIYLIWVWHRSSSMVERGRLLGGGIVGGLGLLFLTFLPWASEGDILSTPISLATRLIQEGSSGAGFSVPVLVYFISQGLGWELTLATIGRIALLIFLVFLVWLWWRTWNGRAAVRGVADTFLAYLLQALNYRIWYAVWPFPFLILDAARSEHLSTRTAYRLRVGVWLLMTSQISVVIYGHMRVELLGGSQVWAHLIGVPFTFLLPWVLALIPWRPVLRGDEPALAGPVGSHID